MIRLRRRGLYYPSSFSRLIVIGLLLVALPLALGLVNSAISIKQLASQSQRAVYQAAQVAKGARVLSDEVTAMERRLRQATILNDPSLLVGYRQSHARFYETARRLAALPLEPSQHLLIQTMIRSEQAIYDKVDSAPSLEAAGAAAGDFVALAETAHQISAIGDTLIEREVDAMNDMAGRALRITQWQLLALIPVAAFLVFGFALLIARPIRQIDAAIRRMGRGDLSGNISVEGPQDLRYLGGRLDWMRQRLAELEEQKSRFLRHLSHELKTPLTSLREGAELLADGVVGPLSGEQRQVAEILRHSGIQLQQLIEDLLSYNSLSQNTLQLNLCPVPLRPIIENVLRDQELAARTKQLQPEVQGDAPMVQADEEKLRVIVDNLLSNAVKFSPVGGRIDLMLGHAGRDATLDVVDQGPGIAAEDRDRIFEAFYQGRAAADGYVKGTGLGLAIANELALAHGGRITVVDNPAGGAHFRLTLPLAAETENA